jgi:hypothetical protein
MKGRGVAGATISLSRVAVADSLIHVAEFASATRVRAVVCVRFMLPVLDSQPPTLVDRAEIC